MESSNDYDALLRSIFDSCDSTGSGFISATDFEELCSQLSLQVNKISVFFITKANSLRLSKFRSELKSHLLASCSII